ncbi:psbQ-like protein [Artemisia annua]|uniref:PsbQ-like protein n=2 Tax=Artemisia annua TaxID=35608 RepID=A0A2U1MDV0_ARTAN|nr:psbQ-like protein [Artemisia annua]
MTTTIFHPQITTTYHRHRYTTPPIHATLSNEQIPSSQRRKFIISISTSISALALTTLNNNSNVALAESWGTRSFIKERFFEPGLSAEDAVARIKQTREGLHSIRNMLETMSWRYVLFYIRLKSAYLSQDLKNAMSIVPESSKNSYVKAANELVDNMSEFDYYVRTPKVYESYLYYEKTLQSIDDLVAVLA